jgi:uncharacterized coiled-coil protein SlyX
MFKLKKKVTELEKGLAASEKRIADLEMQVQSQQIIRIDVLANEVSHQVAKRLKEQNKLGFC